MNDSVITTNNSRVLMSDALKQVIPEIDETILSKQKILLASLFLEFGEHEERNLVAKLVGLQTTKGDAPEIEVRCHLDDAFLITSSLQKENCDVCCTNFEVIYDDVIVDTYTLSTTGKWRVRTATIHDINPELAMCTLLIKLSIS